MTPQALEARQGVFGTQAISAMAAAQRRALEIVGDLRGPLDRLSGLELRQAVAAAVVDEARRGIHAPDVLARAAVANLLRSAERAERAARTRPAPRASEVGLLGGP